MTKSELIELLAAKNSHLNHKDVELAVKSLIEQMSLSLSTGNRIEIRVVRKQRSNHRTESIAASEHQRGGAPSSRDPWWARAVHY